MIIIRKAVAFIKKSFIMQKNYPLAFFISVFHIVFSMALFYFLAKLFDKSEQSIDLGRYKGDLFTFFLIGLAYAKFLDTWLTCFSESFQNEFYSGTLESVLATPTGAFQILFLSILWPQIFAALQVLIYFVVGVSIFGAHISFKGYLLALIITIISMLTIAGIGIISAALLIIFKRGNLLRDALYFSSLLLSGVYFPIEILPRLLQKISLILPTTYSLRAIRGVLTDGYNIDYLYSDVRVLLIFAAVLFPLSLYVFKKAFLHAKAAGSLTHY